MLDYEVDGYILDFILQEEMQIPAKEYCSENGKIRYIRNTIYPTTKRFNSEDEAISYIKANRNNWAIYKLQKIQNAIIDF